MRARSRLIALLLALGVLLIASTTLAQSGGVYDLSWNTIDGGGATFSAGGAYSLGGTIGQADVGTLTGGSFSLAGGFWGGALPQSRLYLPLALRSN